MFILICKKNDYNLTLKMFLYLDLCSVKLIYLKTIIPFQTDGISIKLNTIKSEWPSVYIEGSQVIIVKRFCFSLKFDFV